MQPLLAFLLCVTAVAAQGLVLVGYIECFFVVIGVGWINRPIGALNSGLVAYTVGPSQTVVSQAFSVVSQINAGKTSISTDPAGPITDLAKAYSLVSQYQTIVSQFSTLASNYIAKKTVADANGQKSALSLAIVAQRNAAASFFTVATERFQGSASAARPAFQTSVAAPALNALSSAAAVYI